MQEPCELTLSIGDVGGKFMKKKFFDSPQNSPNENTFTKLIMLGELLWRKARHIFLGRTMSKSPLSSPIKICFVKVFAFGEFCGELSIFETFLIQL